MIRPERLTWDHCEALHLRVRQADILDLKTHGSDPWEALSWAMEMPGEAYAVLEGDQVIGAGGWTEAGSVWTLWADLTLGQTKDLLRMAPAWCRIMAIRSRRPLQNVFLRGNSTTEHFLKATGCVDILPQEVIHDGRVWVPFFLKPLEAMPSV